MVFPVVVEQLVVARVVVKMVLDVVTLIMMLS